MRDNAWLFERLRYILRTFFGEISFPNPLVIQFGRVATTRLGSIRRMPDGSSQILINGHFRRLEVPDYVVDAVMGHELTHYIHGFQSDHPKKYRHPHSGGVVIKELTLRGMGETAQKHKLWVDTHWRDFLKHYHPKKVYRRSSRRTIKRHFIWRWI